MGHQDEMRRIMRHKAVLSIGEGDILPNADLAPGRNFEDILWELFKRSYPSYSRKVREACQHPPLEAWVVEVDIGWGDMGHMCSRVQIHPRRWYVGEAEGRYHHKEARQLAAPVPVDHVRVCVILPTEGWVSVFDRHINWEPAEEVEGKIILTDRPAILTPSEKEVATYGQDRSSSSDSLSGSPSAMVQDEILIADETVVTQTKQPGEEATDPSIQTDIHPDPTEETPSGSQGAKGESPEAA